MLKLLGRSNIQIAVKAITSYFMVATLIIGCAGDSFFDQLNSSTSYSGNIIVASASAAPSTAPGTVAMFDNDGNFIRTLRDFFAESELATGLAVFGTSVYALVDGSDRVEFLNVFTGAYSTFSSHVQINSAPVRQMTADNIGNLYIVEYNNNTIEKVDYTGTRVGSPFINTTTGACVLSGPWSIAYIPASNYIVVTNYSANRILFYNATSGACVSSVTNANFSNNATGIVYHSQTNKLIYGRIGNDQIWSANVDGSNQAVAYNNTTRILDPYTLAVDSEGYVYVGASGQDAVEKLSFNGTTLTHVLSGPVVGPNIYTQNPTQVVVLP